MDNGTHGRKPWVAFGTFRSARGGAALFDGGGVVLGAGGLQGVGCFYLVMDDSKAQDVKCGRQALWVAWEAHI